MRTRRASIIAPFCFRSALASIAPLAPVAFLVLGCGGDKRDMEKVCDAEARSGATVAADRAKVLAWIASNAGSDVRKVADEAFAKPPSEASASLRAASAKYGVASCALADALGREEPPPPPPRPTIRPPSALPAAPDPNTGIGSPKIQPAGSLNQAKVEASGGLTQEAAAAAVDSSKITLRLCYERARTKQPRLMGRVKLAVDVGPAGAPIGVKDVGSTIDASVVACMRGILTKTAFPPPSGGRADVTVSYDLMPDD